MNFEIGHSVCDLWTMPECLAVAAKSASRFINKNKVNAFYHPPRSREIERYLEPLLNLHKVPLISKPFSTVLTRWYSYCGEKMHISEINCPNVMLLDCDIMFVHDPTPLWDEDFDVAVMDASMWKKENVLHQPCWLKEWRDLFDKYNRKPIPYFSTGFTLFKDNILKEIIDDWVFYMNEDLPLLYSAFFSKEEMALALAVSDCKIVRYFDNVIKEAYKREEANLPFYSNIKDWEKEPEPIAWHIGYRGPLFVKEF